MQSKQRSAAFASAFKGARFNCAPILAPPDGPGDHHHGWQWRRDELVWWFL